MSKASRERRKEIEQQFNAELFRVAAMMKATPESRELYRNYTSAAVAAQNAAERARDIVAKLRRDDTMNLVGRDRLIHEAIEAGKAEVRKQQQRMAATVKIMRAHLEDVAQPRLPKDREMAAREEMRLLADASPSPVSVLGELAQRDDELGAVATSRYGEIYLRARGTQNAKGLHAEIRAGAAQAATQSSNPQRKAAGMALQNMAAVDGLTGTANYLAGSALNDAETPGITGGDE